MRNCDYCGEQCWAEVPDGILGHILDAITGRGAETAPGRANLIMPTCENGQVASRNKSGWSHDDIVLEAQWAEPEKEPNRIMLSAPSRQLLTQSLVARGAIDAETWSTMRLRPQGREAIAIATVSQRGGQSERKALVVVAGREGEQGSGHVMDIAALRDAVAKGLTPTARAGGGETAVVMADVLDGYDTSAELPVLFIDDGKNGDETLSMFLYGL